MGSSYNNNEERLYYKPKEKSLMTLFYLKNKIIGKYLLRKSKVFFPSRNLT